MDNNEVVSKLVDIEEEAIYKVVRLADEAGVDRDELFLNFASSLMSMALKCSFANFKLK